MTLYDRAQRILAGTERMASVIDVWAVTALLAAGHKPAVARQDEAAHLKPPMPIPAKKKKKGRPY